MRTIYTFIIFSILTFESLGQSNLAFNQVISNTLSISGPISGVYNTSINPTTNYVVPSGKTWKIESIAFYNDNWSQTSAGSGTNIGDQDIPEVILKINGVKVKASLLKYYGNVTNFYSISGNLIEQPIWLKSGDIITFSIRNDCYCDGYTLNGTTNIHLSVIEYSIVP